LSRICFIDILTQWWIDGITLKQGFLYFQNCCEIKIFANENFVGLIF
jgi:hypothetical protein